MHGLSLSIAAALLVVGAGCEAIRERFGDAVPEADPTPEVEPPPPAAPAPSAAPEKADATPSPTAAAPAVEAAPAMEAAPVAKAATIDATWDHSCAIVPSGVACWGGRYARPTDPTAEPHAAPPAVVVRGDFVEIATGAAQDCVLDEAGAVSCWTVPAIDAPLSGITATVVPGLAKATALAGDDEHMCTLQSETDVRCWHAKRTAPGVAVWTIGAPEAIGGVTDAIDLAVSDGFGCVLRNTGDVACWGRGPTIPGEGADTERTARPIEGLANVVAVATGVRHACALGADGRVHCWGEGDDGECGGSKARVVSPPRVVDDLAAATAIATGYGYSCAAVPDGVHCWGSDASAQLGRAERVGDLAAGPGVLGLVASRGSIRDQNDTDEDPTPAPVLGVEAPVLELTAGSQHACARASGDTRCWGERGGARLGDRDLPRGWTELPLADARTMSVGADHVCVVDGSGRVECIGGDHWDAARTAALAALSGVVAIESGFALACALDGGHKVSCRTKDGGIVEPWTEEIVAMSVGAQLLGVTNGNRLLTAKPDGTGAKVLAGWHELGKMRDVAAGGGHYCMVYDKGHVVCFGSNTEGELGLGHARAKPRIATHKWKAAEVDASGSYTCALVGGEVRCWGGSCIAPVRPTRVEGLDDATQIAVAEDRGCARTAGGLVRCWNECERADEGSEEENLLPSAVRPATARTITALAGVAQVGLGSGYACARTDAGKVTCWLMDEQEELVAGRAPAGLGAVAVTLPR